MSTATVSTLDAKIQKCIATHPEWKNHRVANSVRCRVGEVVRVRCGKNPVAASVELARRGKSMDQFRQQFDVKLRIRQGVKKHLQSVYMTDQEFREACGVSTTEWRRYSEEIEFDQFRAKIRGQIFWASAKMLSEMKSIAGIIS
jgi:hypothetical protein